MELIENELNEKSLMDLLTRHASGSGWPFTVSKVEKCSTNDRAMFRVDTNVPGLSFFVKEISGDKIGPYYPERLLAAALKSQSIATLHSKSPVGIMVSNNQDIKFVPPIQNGTRIYEFQIFVAGKSFRQILESRRRTSVTSFDIRLQKSIAKLIAEVHRSKIVADETTRCLIYNHGLKEVMERRLLQIDFGWTNPVLTLEREIELYRETLMLISCWKNRASRLSALHGDFWGDNVRFSLNPKTNRVLTESASLVDYSRIKYGDPGYDVGWWTAEYIWLYTERANMYYLELLDHFLTSYREATGDKEIFQASCIGFAAKVPVIINAALRRGVEIKKVEQFLEYALHVIRRKTMDNGALTQ